MGEDFKTSTTGQIEGTALIIGASPRAAIDSKAIVDLRSTTQGLLLPRMTTVEREAITSPPAGLVVYDSTLSSLMSYVGAQWHQLTIIETERVWPESVGTPTYDNLQDLINQLCSGCVLTGGTITDAGGGTVSVAGGTGLIKTTDSDTGVTKHFDFSAQAGVALTDESVNWIYVNYNAGTPLVATTTNYASIDHHTEIIIGKVWRSGATVRILHVGSLFADYMRKSCFKDYTVHGFERASGSMISETGTRNIALTAGSWYCAKTPVTTAAIDTSGAGTFIAYYRATPSGWTPVLAQTAIDNTYYDDGSGTLAALTANRYGVHWVYQGYDGTVHVVYGQGDYTLAEAEAAQPPSSLPDIVTNICTLVGKVIVKKSAAAFTETQSAFANTFVAAAVADHEELAGLLGGGAGDHYHLTGTQAADLTDSGATTLHTHEGSNVLSTGEAGATKFLREDGDGTSSWQTLPDTYAPVYFSWSSTIDADLAVTSGVHKTVFILPNGAASAAIEGARMMVGTAPVDASLIVDINKNGTTIFTTQGNRPTITTGNTDSGAITAPDVTALANGDYLSVDIDQVGSTTPGKNLVVVLLVKVTY